MKELAGKPFVILGVNSDQDREALKKVLKDEKITWRSWWDGGSTQGPIASKWNVQGWPTVYLIDQQGIIRDKSVGYKHMDGLVAKLLNDKKPSKKP